MINTRDTCRLCDAKTVERIFKMPACPPVDNFRRTGEKEIALPNFPMDLYMCSACKHAQLLDIVSPDILYGNYIYTSSSSPDLDSHFTNYAVHVALSLKLPKTAYVLDVGSNDGLFLSKFAKMGFRVLGVDPSHYVAEIAKEKGIETIVDYFSQTLADKIVQKYGYMDLVTANNVFSHADHLREFALGARRVLADDGTFVFEVSYLKDLVDNLVIDYVYHEHLCYHSVLPLKRFLESCSLKLIDVEHVATKGGSIRCYAAKDTDARRPKPAVEEMIAEEVKSGLYNADTYRLLELRVRAIKESLQEIVRKEILSGKRIAAYGASATSTVLNALLGIAGSISFIVDDNENRQGRLSPGYFIPVLSSDALIHYKPSVTIISAWRFAKGIMQKNQQYLREGGRFIVPFPTIKEYTNATDC